MSAAALAICLAIAQGQDAKPTLNLYQGSFIIREEGKTLAVPLQLTPEKPKLSVILRRNQTFAVWDDRILTIRSGKTVRSFDLNEVSTSPRIFSREEILSNVELMRQKKRKRGASALSGYRRIGPLAMFLARWDDSDGEPWLEALVSVDLTQQNPKPKLVSRLPGFTLSDKAIDDKLYVLGDRLNAVVRNGDAWGVALFDAQTQQFEFKELGMHLESYTPISGRLGAFVERTEYNTRVGGRVDLLTQNRKNLLEAKGAMRFIDTAEPQIALINGATGVVLRNAETGAEVQLPASSAVRRAGKRIVVWSPFRDPKRAWLYDPVRWSFVAGWTATP